MHGLVRGHIQLIRWSRLFRVENMEGINTGVAEERTLDGKLVRTEQASASAGITKHQNNSDPRLCIRLAGAVSCFSVDAAPLQKLKPPDHDARWQAQHYEQCADSSRAAAIVLNRNLMNCLESCQGCSRLAPVSTFNIIRNKESHHYIKRVVSSLTV